MRAADCQPISKENHLDGQELAADWPLCVVLMLIAENPL